MKLFFVRIWLLMGSCSVCVCGCFRDLVVVGIEFVTTRMKFDLGIVIF